MSELMRAYKQFSSEATATARIFFVWKGINNLVSNDMQLRSMLEANALTWKVIIHSLQSTYLLALGRLFDDDNSALSADKLLRLCIENLEEFSEGALRKRKIDENGGVPVWLDDFMKNTYQPNAKDFQRLRGEVKRQRKIYIKAYNGIRNKIIAHRDIDTINKVEEMFKGTDIREIEEFLQVMYQIDQVVFHLLYNGKLRSLNHFEFFEEQRALQDVKSFLGMLKAGHLT